MRDERLIPFLGGLVIGGVGGAASEGNKFNSGYGYYNQPYNYYPYQANYNYPYAYNSQPLPTNSMQYPQYNNMPYNQYYQSYQTDIYTTPGTKLIEENPMPDVIGKDVRGIEDISYVPKYIP